MNYVKDYLTVIAIGFMTTIGSLYWLNINETVGLVWWDFMINGTLFLSALITVIHLFLLLCVYCPYAERTRLWLKYHYVQFFTLKSVGKLQGLFDLFVVSYSVLLILIVVVLYYSLLKIVMQSLGLI